MDSAEHSQLPLSMPHRRSEMVLYLHEMASSDPRTLWSAQREKGLAAGIDEVFHFFFDDNDLDETDIGVTLLNHTEVAAIQHLKAALEIVLGSVGNGDDIAFTGHPMWQQVSAAASNALEQLAAQP
ncbi:hypothetical protein V6R86_08650 [Sphingomonas kaistensis]|uniref:Integron gene cassette protein n=1 Tax=Sphingomonas kaistensis TaxID=298708 RepID=A0ABZ2G4K9_9SPHN